MGAGIELACLLLSIMFQIAFWVLRANYIKFKYYL